MGRDSNIKYKPYVFTEQGVYMLMIVLRGELAIKQSHALVKTFKKTISKEIQVKNKNIPTFTLKVLDYIVLYGII